MSGSSLDEKKNSEPFFRGSEADFRLDVFKSALQLMERRTTNFKVFTSARGHVKYSRLPDRTYLPVSRTEEELTRTIHNIGTYYVQQLMFHPDFPLPTCGFCRIFSKGRGGGGGVLPLFSAGTQQFLYSVRDFIYNGTILSWFK